MTQQIHMMNGNGAVPDAPIAEAVGERDALAVTAVLLCQGLQTAGKGLDVEELRRWLEKADPGVRVILTPDLCHKPGELQRVAAFGAQHVVLGLCSLDYDESEVQSQARQAGLDPHGIEAVDLGEFCDRPGGGSNGMEIAKLLLVAAVAKAGAYPGSSPENIKPYILPLTQKVSRRALFTLPPIRHRVVPSINGRRCIANAGCALCVKACPRDALERDMGKMRLNKSRCEGCGLCMTACTSEAIHFPGNASAQFEAQINALLETDSVALKERRILFTCQLGVQADAKTGRDSSVASDCWLPVQVPCVGMVPVSLILQCLARGAVAVGVASCEAGCTFNQDETIRGRIDYCRDLLRLLGGSPDRVQLVSAGDRPSQEQPSTDLEIGRARGRGAEVSLQSMVGPKATVDALGRLLMEYGASPTFSLEHSHSPLGVVSVEPQNCTGCDLCAGVCPTSALQFERGDADLMLTFDASLCTACGQCAAVCPETTTEVIRVHRVTDLACLNQQRVTLYKDTDTLCEVCGVPVAPHNMVQRVVALLGEEHSALTDQLTRFCPSCREAPGAWSPVPTENQ